MRQLINIIWRRQIVCMGLKWLGKKWSKIIFEENHWIDVNRIYIHTCLIRFIQERRASFAQYQNKSYWNCFVDFQWTSLLIACRRRPKLFAQISAPCKGMSFQLNWQINSTPSSWEYTCSKKKEPLYDRSD